MKRSFQKGKGHIQYFLELESKQDTSYEAGKLRRRCMIELEKIKRESKLATDDIKNKILLLLV
jgi:hypothetical protein